MVSVPMANSRLVQNPLGITAGTLLNVFQSCRRQEPRGLSFGHRYLHRRIGLEQYAQTFRDKRWRPSVSVSIATSGRPCRGGALRRRHATALSVYNGAMYAVAPERLA